jgi:hypothetical protein
MDAMRIAASVCAALALPWLSGCIPPSAPAYQIPQLHAGADGRTQAVLPAADEDPAENGPDADEADIDRAVQGYIQRIDDVQQRLRRPAPDESTTWNSQFVPVTDPSGILTPAGDPYAAELDTERPAVEPPTAGIPQREDVSIPIETPAASDGSDLPPRTAPPALGSVTVRANPALLAAAPPAAEVGPARVNQAATARRAPLSLEQFLEQWAVGAEESSFRRQLDRRLMQAVAGDYEAARAPLTMVSDEQHAMAGRFVEALIAIREAHDGDASVTLTRVLDELDRLANDLRPLSDLQIPALTICQEIRGFGDYTPIQPPHFMAGLESEFVLYCEVRNFVTQQEEDGLYVARFELRTAILDDGGQIVLEIRDADVVDRCRQQRQDCFIPRLVRLPATLPAGDYVAKVTVVDRLGDKLAESRVTFRVLSRS